MKPSMEEAPLILFGNESHGLSGQYDTYLKGRISIPSFAGEGGRIGITEPGLFCGGGLFRNEKERLNSRLRQGSTRNES